jgi:sRNA-binding protein
MRQLAERYPKLFRAGLWEVHLPMKCGIHNDIVALHPEFDVKALRLVMRIYVARLAYQRALMHGGARFNLAGEVEGEVTPEQVEHAKERVSKILAEREAEAAKAKVKVVAARQAKAAPKPPQPAAPEPTPISPAAPKCDGLAGLRAAAQARKVAWTCK